MELPLPRHAAPCAWFINQGWSRAAIDRAVRRGQLARPTRGWLLNPAADPAVVQALGNDGIVSCISALELHGLDVLRPRRLHLRPLRATPSPGRTWCLTWRTHPKDVPIDPPEVALEAAIRCLEGEQLLVVLDSALRQWGISAGDLEFLLSFANKRKQRLRELMGSADAVGESLVHHRLRARRIRFRPQVYIDGVGRVDMLIGERLVLEVDGRRYHSDDAAFVTDRRRDRLLQELGYLVLRITYTDIHRRWPTIEAQILTFLRADRHRRHPLGLVG